MNMITFDNKFLRYLFAVFVLCMSSFSSHAQLEPTFTQYMFNETFINPAYAGSREGLAMNMAYRDQWVGLKGSPKTQTLSIHMPIEKKKIGIGLSVMNETIGVSHKFLVNGDFAYRIKLYQSFLAFGLKAGFVNDQENYSEVNTTTPGDRQFTNDVRKYFLPNAGFGVYYYKKKFYAGFSIPRLLENKIDPSQPNKAVRNMGNFKVWHYYLTSGYVMNLTDYIKFKPTIMLKCVQNAPVEFDASINFLLDEIFWIGLEYRTGDAISCLLGFQISKSLRIAYSYDYTLTDLQKYNSGSHEITLSYDISIYKTRITSLRYF